MRMRGFSVLEALLVLVVVGLTFAGMAVAFDYQARHVASNKRRVEVVAFQDSLSKLMTNIEICSCQLDRQINRAAAGVLFIDTNLKKSQDIPLQLLRSSCNFGRTADNILIALSQPLVPGGPVVEDIRITEIAPTGEMNEYEGLLQVRVRPSAEGATFPVVETPLRLAVDDSSGTPDSRRIKSCLGPFEPSHGIVECPSGFTLVGVPGNKYAFCMDTNPRPAARHLDAYTICNSVKPAGFNTAHICEGYKWRNACRGNVARWPAPEEWVDYVVAFEVAPASYLGTRTGCDITPRTYDAAATRPFRCCL